MLCLCLCCHHVQRHVGQQLSRGYSASQPLYNGELSLPSWLPSPPSPLHPHGPGSSLLGMTHTLLTPLSPLTALLCNWRSCCLDYLLKLANAGSDFNRYKRVDRGKSPSHLLPQPRSERGRCYAYADMKMYRHFAFQCCAQMVAFRGNRYLKQLTYL